MKKNKEFNPTETNAVDLEGAIIDLKSKKSDLVSKKINKQLKIAKIKDILNNPKLDNSEYIEAKQKRVKLRQDLNVIEHAIKEINLQVSAKRKLLISVTSHLKTKKNETELTSKILEKISELRDKYASFSADNTRISSMRIMSSQIALELEEILNTI